MSWGLLPIVLRLAARRNLYDTVDQRKIHRGNIPRLGGIVFVPSLGISILSVLALNVILGRFDLTDSFSKDAVPLLFMALSCGIMYISGVADDIFTLRYRVKFIVQIIVGVLLCFGGLWVDNLWGVLGVYNLPEWAGMPLTVLLTVFVINAFNLIDGIDGLCASLSLLAMLSYGVCFLICSDVPGVIFCTAVIGLLLPYLYYNMFGNAGNGTKLFMGDTGSTTLGLMIVALAFRLMNDCADESPFSANPAILSLAPVMLPCFDVVRVYFVRLKARRSPFLPDRNHIHHRLLDCGLSQHGCLASLLITSAVWCVGNVLLSIWVDINIILILDVLFWLFSTSLLRSRIEARSRTIDSAG